MSVKDQTHILTEFANQHRLLGAFKDKMNSLLNELLYVKKIAPHQIVCRVKERDSLAQKIERKKDKYSSLNDITDIVGIRIITYFEDDVDRIASIIEKEFEIDAVNSIDKRILETDKFGYRSLHYVVSINKVRSALEENKIYKGLKAEIQVRSILQHAWAEIEHDIGYKGEVEIPKVAKRSFYRIAALLETADIEFVKLKETLKKYESELANNIVRQPETVTLDKASLEKYISESPIVQKVDKVIFAEIKNEQIGKGLASISMTLPRIKYFNINTIKELEITLKNHQSIIPLFYKEFVAKIQTKTFFQGMSVFHLAYVLATEDEDIEKTRKFCQDVMKMAAPAHLAKQIMDAYLRAKALLNNK